MLPLNRIVLLMMPHTRRATVAIGPRVIGKEAACFSHRLGEARTEVCTTGDNPIKRRCGVRPGRNDFA